MCIVKIDISEDTRNAFGEGDANETVYEADTVSNSEEIVAEKEAVIKEVSIDFGM
ncbi:hypothetical protein [Microscilla marina]|uniref:Uncharacterized protein n=1 Tax=Microscilla marina ATCC 23134 TaxID=313606 RepID=A1ZFZ6_MICM2|nr:hypothetical protein [Microscilla marina]EAY30920.1 hypothetical protein M23134_01244 [Microscilla marina ATCC 23134]